MIWYIQRVSFIVLSKIWPLKNLFLKILYSIILDNFPLRIRRMSSKKKIRFHQSNYTRLTKSKKHSRVYIVHAENIHKTWDNTCLYVLDFVPESNDGIRNCSMQVKIPKTFLVGPVQISRHCSTPSSTVH